MRSIAELSTDPATTKIGTAGITDTQPTIWATEVLRSGEALRKLDQVVLVNKEMVGSKAEKVTLSYQTSHLNIDVAPTDTTYPEGTARDMTEMTNLDTGDLSIANTDFKKGAIAIGKEIFMTCALDLMSNARYMIAQDMADDVDLALATMLLGTGDSPQQLWGGDATTVETLTTGDVLTTDLIADGMRQIEVNDFAPKYFIISPWQVSILRKDSQFMNASEYGSDRVVLKGEIGEYLGLIVIVTTNTNFNYTSDDTEPNEGATVPNVTNGITVCPIIGETPAGQKVCGALGWKEMPHIDMEYEKNEARHLIFYDQAFTTVLLNVNAISLIKVANS